MLFVSLSISRNEIEIIIGIYKNLNLLICARTDSSILLSSRRQELQCAEIDIKSGVLNKRHL
jgi:hypothetical protein